ncbi:methyltransferase domain-containing protein [Cokeromyces recurvatus]|uniref:methyltransferase domain-containing protein n=1 Tax=Cokeromyces recurvatus TaxID=90255 RepID=UPI002220F1C2|nr:methyltransferase domain-containing protein [Cokeromyces recurvatus]KAI7900480.1 methyltransferase domain-containing protein [Cokeromyces recurvatus]
MKTQIPLTLPLKYKNDSPEEYLEKLISFYKQYHWLVHVLAFNFITQQEWQKFPLEWREALMHYMEKAGDNWAFSILELTSDKTDYSIWPESLQEYLKMARDLALPRVVDESIKKQQQSISKHILGGMSDKKIHEVQLMSQLIKNVADEKGITSVIDLGSGQGYLSRALAFDYGMEVLAVDMSEIQTQGALRFDKKAMKAQRSYGDDGKKNSPNLKHVTEKITPENISQVLTKWSPNSSKDKCWLVTGLHTCGDLSPLIFNLFAKSKEVSCVVNVGCCYNALTSTGFPMSNFLKKKNDLFELSSTARVLSCHSPSRWIDEGEQCIKAFDNYYFRALLQEILVEKGLSDIHDPPRLGRIKQNKDFVSFVAASLKRLKLPKDTISAEEAEMQYLESKKNQVDKQFVALWTLRGLLAPIIESIILMDRWLYLNESLQNASNDGLKGVWMYPLFDLSASPRNVVYVASK